MRGGSPHQSRRRFSRTRPLRMQPIGHGAVGADAIRHQIGEQQLDGIEMHAGEYRVALVNQVEDRADDQGDYERAPRHPLREAAATDPNHCPHRLARQRSILNSIFECYGRRSQGTSAEAVSIGRFAMAAITETRAAAALLILRISLGVFLVQWSLEKIIAQGSAIRVAQHFYGEAPTVGTTVMAGVGEAPLAPPPRVWPCRRSGYGLPPPFYAPSRSSPPLHLR